VYINFM